MRRLTMNLRERFEDYRRRIRFGDLDLASRAMALLWLDIFRERVFRNCFPRVGSQSLLREVGEVIDATFMEGYILARAAYGQGTESVLFTDPARPGSVEEGVERLRLMYEEEAVSASPFADEPLGVEALAESLVREVAYGPRLVMLEERELLKVHLIYALWAGYRLAAFERRLRAGGREP
ncbi:MAG: hypothetical protein H5T73_06265 [Actinobacteria bacterium]|nr:hypothetical protein [Actinomycetota bacterium]